MRKLLLLMVLGLGAFGLTASKSEAAPPGVFYRPPSYGFMGATPAIRYSYSYNPGYSNYSYSPGYASFYTPRYGYYGSYYPYPYYRSYYYGY